MALALHGLLPYHPVRTRSLTPSSQHRNITHTHVRTHTRTNLCFHIKQTQISGCNNDFRNIKINNHYFLAYFPPPSLVSNITTVTLSLLLIITGVFNSPWFCLAANFPVFFPPLFNQVLDTFTLAAHKSVLRLLTLTVIMKLSNITPLILGRGVRWGEGCVDQSCVPWSRFCPVAGAADVGNVFNINNLCDEGLQRTVTSTVHTHTHAQTHIYTKPNPIFYS